MSRMRSVAMRPVKRVFRVTPSRATWRAMVLKAASVALRWALESMSESMGSRTAVEDTLRIRPKRRSRMPGITLSTSARGNSTSVR